MPDLISIGLGGGSIIRENNNQVSVGPDSVGYKLDKEALIFGGKTLQLLILLLLQVMLILEIKVK